MDLLPIPVLICVHKFDSIKSLEPEGLRVLSRAVRAVAHASGASLLYTSRAHRDTLLKNYRARVTAHVMANVQAATKPNFDHTQFIATHAGQDSFASIGDAPGAAPSGKANATPLAGWVAAFNKYFDAGSDKDKDKDREEGLALEELVLEPEKTVDAALAQRQEDLKRMQRELDLRRKLNAKETETTPMATNTNSVRVR